MTRRTPRSSIQTARVAALPPEIRSVVASLQGGRLSRRSALRGAGALGLGAFLAACGTTAPGAAGGATTSAAAGPATAADVSDTDKKVDWANWTLYLDYDDATKTYPSLEAFKTQTGLEATYSEDIEDNDSYYGKIQGQLAGGQDIGQDIVVLTDWMAARMITMGFTQELDAANVPNAKNLLASLQDVDFDPGRKHTLTWQSGFAGVAWNKAEVPGGIRTVSDLWKPELKGRIDVLSEWRDTIGLIMSEQGVDISGAWGSAEYGKAIEVLQEQIGSGQIRQVKGNSYKEDLISGDAVAVIGWSGDITQINAENDDKWEFAIPESGGTLFSDDMMVPIGSRHKKNAETLMNYYLDPVVAAQVAAYVNYICPVEGAQAELAKTDPELAANTSIFPDEATLKTVKLIRTLTADEDREFSGTFSTAVGT